MTALVGILNITPDSFSDGGKYNLVQSAVDHAVKMHNDGAAVIDIGAESTRPGAQPLTADEEWARLAPVLEKILEKRRVTDGFKPLISVDTRHQLTAQKSLDLGVHWINDVSGAKDPELCKTVAYSSAQYVLMHSLTVPADSKHVLPAGTDPVEEVIHWLEDRLVLLETRGLPRHRVIVDPGIGFGKTADQSFLLLRQISRFKKLGVRILVGHSRKSFLTKLTNKPFEQRDLETIIASLFLFQEGIDYLRVHDVAGHAAAFRVASALEDDEL